MNLLLLLLLPLYPAPRKAQRRRRAPTGKTLPPQVCGYGCEAKSNSPGKPAFFLRADLG